MYQLGDYPGLLKQAHRFAVVDGLEEEIDQAIVYHERRGLQDQAVAWRRKFAELRHERSAAESGLGSHPV